MPTERVQHFSRRFGLRAIRPSPLRLRTKAPWHWFDHPEMQARIARAEADLEAGRFWEGSIEEWRARMASATHEWCWFDHPEMRARIAEAEADFAAGRYSSGSSLEELLAQLRAIRAADDLAR